MSAFESSGEIIAETPPDRLPRGAGVGTTASEDLEWHSVVSDMVSRDEDNILDDLDSSASNASAGVKEKSSNSKNLSSSQARRSNGGKKSLSDSPPEDESDGGSDSGAEAEKETDGQLASTSTPIARKGFFNLDVSILAPRPSNIANMTIADQRLSTAVHQQNAMAREKQNKPYRRIIVVDSSSEDEEKSTEGKQPKSNDSSYFSNGERSRESQSGQDVRQDRGAALQQSSGHRSSSLKDSSRSKPQSEEPIVIQPNPTSSKQISDGVLGATHEMNHLSLQRGSEVVNIDDLEQSLNGISISQEATTRKPAKKPVKRYNFLDNEARGDGRHRKAVTPSDSETEESEDETATEGGKRHEEEVVLDDSSSDESEDDIQVLHDFEIPEPKRQPVVVKTKVPSQKKTIFLEDLPTPLPTNKDSGANIMLIDKFVNEIAATVNNAPAEDDVDPLGHPKYLLPELYAHQKYGLHWMWWREATKPFGGVLADEMGLGKTVMLLALICRSKEQKEPRGKESKWISPDEKRLVPSDTNLVVCPASVMGQWMNEAQTKCPRLKIYNYHGSNRKKSAAVLSRYDVVVTTYDILKSEIRKLTEQSAEACNSPLVRIKWRRVILDEAHVIRNHATTMSQAACRLQAEHRWFVTGTPIHNRAGDFFSVAKFLHLTPFDELKVWEQWIGMKMPNSKGSERLAALSKALLLRREKSEVNITSDSGSLKGIPPKTVLDVLVQLKEDEREIYNHVYDFLSDQFKQLVQSKEKRDRALQSAADNYVAGRPKPGGGGDKNMFAKFFVILLRSRQAAVHPTLIKAMIEDHSVDMDITYDPAEEFATMKNPVFDEGYKSAKLEKLFEDLDDLKRECKAQGNPMDKVVIVSQWTTLLSIIEYHLKLKGYSCCTISGQVKISDRTDIMMKFNNDPKRPQIMLLSLQAGGVGLNLVGANHLFFMDVHWNPQLELQAQDRIHRFGQKKPVTIKRYISDNTIESRVLELQNSKLALADGLLKAGSRRGGTGLGINEMKMLFQM